MDMKKLKIFFRFAWFALEKVSSVLILFVIGVLTAVISTFESDYIGLPDATYLPHLAVSMGVVALGSWLTLWFHRSWLRTLYSLFAGIILVAFTLVGIHAVRLMPIFINKYPMMADGWLIIALVIGVLYIPVLIVLMIYIYINLYCRIGENIKEIF